jgi:hypothetical protein
MMHGLIVATKIPIPISILGAIIAIGLMLMALAAVGALVGLLVGLLPSLDRELSIGAGMMGSLAGGIAGALAEFFSDIRVTEASHPYFGLPLNIPAVAAIGALALSLFMTVVDRVRIG